MLVGMLAFGAALAGFAPGARASSRETPPRTTVPARRNDPLAERRRTEIRERRAAGDIGWLFLGDSITQRWDPEIWRQSFDGLNAANFGVDGDRTQHLLWRITRGGELDGLSPHTVVVLIGVNNIATDPPSHIAAGIGKIVDVVHEKLPSARILLFAIFPAGFAPGPFRERIRNTNDLVADIARRPYVQHLNIGERFLDAEGRIPRALMPDALHPSPAGYRVWADALGEHMRESRKHEERQKNGEPIP